MLLYEKHSRNQGRMLVWRLRTEILVIVAAFLSFTGSIAAISFGNIVSHIKDDDLDAYKTSAGLQIAKADQDAAKARYDAASASKNAGEAQTKAEQARQHAEAIRANAEEARQNSLKAEAEAQKAVLDKERILHDNLELQRQVEDEKMARLQLEQKIAPRELTKIAQDRLIAELRPLKLKEVEFVTFTGNAEASNVASQLQYAFETVGVKISLYSPLSGSLQGIIIEYDMNDASASKGARSLADALTASGMQQILSPNLPPIGTQLGAYTSSNGASGTAKIRVFVGSK
jgi:hypothetical protein